jgi:hypothetical protein
MNPKVVKAWSCGLCNHAYPHNEHGKRWAEDCCKCTQCGEPSSHTGRGMLCRRCLAAKNLQSAREHMGQQKKYLEEAEEAARKLGIEV